MTNRRFKVVLDPGHGGHDPGAVGPTGLKEKDVTLAVARRAASLLAPLVDVKLTRDTDRDFSPVGKPFSSDIDIGHRARQLVNKSDADVCVSVHCNSLSTRPKAHGVETFHHIDKPQDLPLAGAIQNRLVVATGRADRGVKTANFGMIRIPTMTSALTELPFISNPAEERLLRDPGFQDRCAKAIAEGIAHYLGLEEGLLKKVKVRVEDKGGAQKVVEGLLIGDTTYTPLRETAEFLGKTVHWDGVKQEVIIK